MEKDDVVFLKGAEINIFQIYSYIVLLGYPETSENFIERLYSFGYSIAHFPNKYPICRFKKFGKRKLHCTIFENSYILNITNCVISTLNLQTIGAIHEVV